MAEATGKTGFNPSVYPISVFSAPLENVELLEPNR